MIYLFEVSTVGNQH